MTPSDDALYCYSPLSSPVFSGRRPLGLSESARWPLGIGLLPSPVSVPSAMSQTSGLPDKSGVCAYPF